MTYWVMLGIFLKTRERRMRCVQSQSLQGYLRRMSSSWDCLQGSPQGLSDERPMLSVGHGAIAKCLGTHHTSSGVSESMSNIKICVASYMWFEELTRGSNEELDFFFYNSISAASAALQQNKPSLHDLSLTSVLSLPQPFPGVWGR